MSGFRFNLMPDSIAALSTDDELKIEQILLILRQDYDEHAVHQLMRKFCHETTSEEIRKKGMEFLYMYGYYDDLQRLITKNRSSESPSNRKWAEVYQLTLDRKQRRYPANDVLRKASKFRTDETELKCLIEFIKLAVYFSRHEYGMLGNILEKQQQLFEKVTDCFMLAFFHNRLDQNLFVYYLVRNEAIIARKYAFRALKEATSPITKISLHIRLGLSYMHDTYLQGIYHLTEALKLAKKENLQTEVENIEQRNIPFLSAHFNQLEGITSTDISEQAHIEIAKGNYAKAEALLSEIEINSPFKLYYLGMAKQDERILLQSYNDFIEKRSDYFFSRLPLNALRKMTG
ncbi:AimR family lysis-lysogeny pheromone receptor [Lentibacillus jeotgali]|uniref:AimR family lysis-lysogeny pheromone receptor n=1 Tax=Lentibacillus jeotgali TaxID=558169 RepID=UPI00026260A6|nr:AimR family lysis-lysogeny pheromone receptor [Lentibacillus jeotgali]